MDPRVRELRKLENDLPQERTNLSLMEAAQQSESDDTPRYVWEAKKARALRVQAGKIISMERRVEELERSIEDYPQGEPMDENDDEFEEDEETDAQRFMKFMNPKRTKRSEWCIHCKIIQAKEEHSGFCSNDCKAERRTLSSKEFMRK